MTTRALTLSVLALLTTLSLAATAATPPATAPVPQVPPTVAQPPSETPAPAAPEAPPAPLPVLTVLPVGLDEGNAGASVLRFPVELSAPSARPVTVQYTTKDLTAVAESDYDEIAGELVFEPGDTVATVDVTIHGDNDEEADEELELLFADAVGLALVDAEGAPTKLLRVRGEIRDDDGAAGPGSGPELSIRDGYVAEGNTGRSAARFSVELSTAATQPVTVELVTADGRAVAGEDYQETATTLRFPAGTTSRTVSIAVFGDLRQESDEDFVVELRNPIGAELAQATAYGMILDDDGAGAVSLSAVGSPVRQGRPGQLVVLQVRLRSAAGEPVGDTAVSWRLDGDGDLLAGVTTMTDREGIATQRLQLSSNAGWSAVSATGPDLDQVVFFQVGVSAPPGN